MVKKEISRKLFKDFELNENENTTYQNAQDAAKTKLKVKFIALNLCIGKEERSQINKFIPYKNIKIRANKIISKQTKINDKNQQKSMIMKTGNQYRKSTKPKTCSLKQLRSMRFWPGQRRNRERRHKLQTSEMKMRLLYRFHGH